MSVVDFLPMVALGLNFDPPLEDIDDRVLVRDISWQEYARIAARRGESAVPRLAYLDGTLELMSPGTRHETDKKKLSRLLEAYADHLGIAVDGYGSWTVQREGEKAGAEADECYVVDPDGSEPAAPDLVIEVVYRSGGLSKLELWKRLGAREVWFWIGKGLRLFVRRGDDWQPASRSDLLPAVDPALLERCMAEPSQTAALKTLRAALAATT